MRLTEKNLKRRENDSYIEKQYEVEYYINSLSRYKHSSKLKLADGTIILSNLNPHDMIVIPHTQSSIYVVGAGEENRIDIIAYNVYGTATLYWVLCYANSIDDPLDLPIGTILNIPNIRDLYMVPNPLS